jgi:hypothetical protein
MLNMNFLQSPPFLKTISYVLLYHIMIMRKNLWQLSQSSRCQEGHNYNGSVLFCHLRAARHAHCPPGKCGHHVHGSSFLRFHISAMHNMDFRDVLGSAAHINWAELSRTTRNYSVFQNRPHQTNPRLKTAISFVLLMLKP